MTTRARGPWKTAGMTDTAYGTASDVIGELFRRAGCEGSLLVQRLDGEGEFGILADEPVVLASAVKVLVALEAEARMADGRWDPCERVRLEPADLTPGPSGFSFFEDAVELSLRDAVWPMLTISDNPCTDALTRRIGVPGLNAAARRLGLAGTVVESDLHTMIDSTARTLGFADWAAASAWAATGPSAAGSARVNGELLTCAALDPHRATRSTPRDMVRLLRLIWADEAGPAAACARVRAVLARQLTRHRIASGFRAPVRVAAKSGGLFGVIRNEVGVVTYPDGPRYAVAVFTRTRPGADEAAVNACVGAAASRAVAAVREACGA